MWNRGPDAAARRYRGGMRLATLPPSLALAAVVLGTLAGCVGDDPALVPPPEPTSTPVFASDEEALAAAEQAYAAYFRASDSILNDGGADPERLQAFASEEMYQLQLGGYREAQLAGLRSVGATVVDSIILQSYDASSSDGEGIVTVYACVDVTNVDLVDATGNSVVSASRPNRTSVEAVFDLSSQDSGHLVLASEEQWAGRERCGS